MSTDQFSSVTQLCPTLCDPMNRSAPGLPVHHQLLESTQTHVHWVGNAIQPSHPLLSGVISPLISSSILGTYRPGEFIFQCPIFLPFHTVQTFFKKYWNLDICNDMDGSRRYYAKWNKSETEIYILYDMYVHIAWFHLYV